MKKHLTPGYPYFKRYSYKERTCFRLPEHNSGTCWSAERFRAHDFKDEKGMHTSASTTLRFRRYCRGCHEHGIHVRRGNMEIGGSKSSIKDDEATLIKILLISVKKSLISISIVRIQDAF